MLLNVFIHYSLSHTNPCEELQVAGQFPELLRSGGRKSLIVESFAGEVEVPDVRVGTGDRDGHVAEDDGPRDLLVERRSRYSLHRALISFGQEKCEIQTNLTL